MYRAPARCLIQKLRNREPRDRVCMRSPNVYEKLKEQDGELAARRLNSIAAPSAAKEISVRNRMSFSNPISYITLPDFIEILEKIHKQDIHTKA